MAAPRVSICTVPETFYIKGAVPVPGESSPVTDGRRRTSSVISVTSRARGSWCDTPDSAYFPQGFGVMPSSAANGEAIHSQRSSVVSEMPAHPDGAVPERRNSTFSDVPMRMRLRTESGFGMPVSPWLQEMGGLPAGMPVPWPPGPYPGAVGTAPATAAAPAMVTQQVEQPTQPTVVRQRLRTESTLGMPVAWPEHFAGAQPQPTQAPVKQGVLGGPVEIQNVAPAVYMQAQPRVPMHGMPYGMPMMPMGMPGMPMMNPMAFPYMPHYAAAAAAAARGMHHQPAMPVKTTTRVHGGTTKVANLSVLTGPRTTVMLHNLPEGYTRRMLLNLLDSEGFEGKYDFAYLPVAFDTLTGLNHAFVNMLSPAEADRLQEHFNGFKNWEFESDKVCSVSWNDKQQGLEALVERYRNSPVMHESVPEECKPLLIVDGRHVLFPPPTQRIKAPKLGGKQKAAA